MSISQANRAWKAEGAKRREKQEQSRNLPSRWQGGSSKSFRVIIDQGNELETGQDGVVYYEGTLASVPSAYDPDVTSTFIDGIGRGTLQVNGVSQPGYVLVVNDDRGTFRNAVFQNDPIQTSGAVSIPVDGGGSIKAYTLGT